MSAQTPPLSLTLVDGTTVLVPDSLDALTTYILQEQGDWFEDEIKFLRRWVQPGQVVVDIGANYGVYALSLARRVGPEGQVWAFEPATDTAQYLARSIEANGTSWVRLETTALSDHEGTGWLQKPGQSELNSLASAGGESDSSSEGNGERVALSTLDASRVRFGWSTVDLLKIDAEGEEMRILEGGKTLFRDMSPLVMFELKEGATLHLELLERFNSLGYGCYRLVPGLDVLVPFHPEEGVEGYLLNLFAAKPDRAAALAASGWLVTEEEMDPSKLASPAIQASDRQAALSQLEALPYGIAFASHWSKSPDPVGAAAHLEALALWQRAHNGTLPAAWRFKALQQSYELLLHLAAPGGPASRWSSLARVAVEIGERAKAMDALACLSAALQEGRKLELSEPFLPPHPVYDSVVPGAQPAQWLEAALLEAQECYGAFSGFFTGTSSAPRLERLSALGMASAAMQRRLALLQRRFSGQVVDQWEGATLTEEEVVSVRPWFDLLGLGQPLRCLDVGAMELGGTPEPWVRWAREGCAEVIGFEPLPEECERLNQQVKNLGVAVRYLPFALGDGGEHTLHVTNAPMTSSLYPPARATVDLFPGLGEWMQVESQSLLRTHRLDDLAEVRPADFLKLDVQGAELMVLQQALDTLGDLAVVQCEVEFVELYEGQPLMADVDTFLRNAGFSFLKFSSLQGRPFKPLRLEQQPLSPISQILWADAVYVRDFRDLSRWSNRQLKAASFLLHELYNATDLVSLLLGEIDLRESTDVQSLYLASMLMSNPSLVIG